jgi:hypothetical protein
MAAPQRKRRKKIWPDKPFTSILELRAALDRGDFTTKDLVVMQDYNEFYFRSKTGVPDMDLFYTDDGGTVLCELLGIRVEHV